MLTETEIDAAVRDVVLYLRPKLVILHGSYAKGTATATSDLDLLAIVETALPRRARTTNLPDHLPDSLVPLDVMVYTPEEIAAYRRDRHSLVASVLRYGRVVYRDAPVVDGRDG